MNIGYLGNFNFGLRALSQNQDLVSDSLEKLATGKRINRASDDPSGMVASEGMKARIYSIESELKSFNQQEFFLGAKEGGLSVISDQFQTLNAIVVQAANLTDASAEEQDALKVEINSIITGIDQIVNTTSFKGEYILSEYSNLSDSQDFGNLAELIFDDPQAAQEFVTDTINKVATKRGAIGNQLRDIDSRRNVLNEEFESLTGSLSQIEDVDYAKEASNLVRAQILESASIAAIEISRDSAKQLLGLLQDATQLGK
jgi:flagellin